MEQITDYAAAQREARPLYAPLRTFPACAGNCGQGRKPCVTPEACCMPEEDAPGAGAGVLIWPVACAIASLAVLFLVW